MCEYFNANPVGYATKTTDARILERTFGGNIRVASNLSTADVCVLTYNVITTEFGGSIELHLFFQRNVARKPASLYEFPNRMFERHSKKGGC
jgi:hypothetical protein